MSDILQRILRRKAEEVGERQQRLPLPALREQLVDAPPVRGFAMALQARIAPQDVRFSPPARYSHVSTTVSGLSERLSMPSSISHFARSGWSEGPCPQIPTYLPALRHA